MRFIFHLLLCSLSIGAHSILAEVPLQGRLIHDGKGIIKIKKGDILNAIIEIWPADRINQLRPSDIDNKVILNSFYVGFVESISHSENNQDVLQIRTPLILLKNFKDMSLHLLEIGDEKIPIHLENIEVIVNEGEGPEKFILLDHELKLIKNRKYIFIFLISVSFILIVFLIAVCRKRLKATRERKLIYKRKEYWNSIFHNANAREDFEKILNGKQDWMSLIGLMSPPLKVFLDSINYYQYKKEWTEQEKIEVKMYFDEIREIFNKNDI